MSPVLRNLLLPYSLTLVRQRAFGVCFVLLALLIRQGLGEHFGVCFVFAGVKGSCKGTGREQFRVCFVFPALWMTQGLGESPHVCIMIPSLVEMKALKPILTFGNGSHRL